jgi:hypothetical protein
VSGSWRVVVDSWITPEATWYARRTWNVDGFTVHSLSAALQAVADADYRDLLGEHRVEQMLGAAPPTDFPADPAVLDLIGDPNPRPTVQEALDHLWGMLTVEQTSRLREERPDIAVMLYGAHQATWHEHG